jgi:hypothetical protein
MNHRILWSGLGVALLAVALTIASATYPINNSRAEGPSTAAAKEKQIKPVAGVSLEGEPPRSAEPSPAPASAPTPAPAAPAGRGSLEQYPSTAPGNGTTPPATFGPPATEAAGMITVQEVLQLKALKRRIGGENVKRLVDALGD